MQLKRFRAATVAEALNRARAEMGPDALVLSTRLVPSRGVRGWMGARGVEVTVAIERDMSEDRLPCPSGRHGQPPDVGAVVARLQAGGLDVTFAREVAAALPKGARRGASLVSLRRALAASLTPVTAGDEGHAPIEVFVGPPGAGKTTTIAKIGAQERARRGKRMSLLAADAYRVGAIEQLRMYADIIGSPFFVAHSASDLERAFASADSPMLVDTAGRSPNDAAARDLFAAIDRRPDVRTHLVMPAGTSAADGARILDRYADAHPDRVVLTHVDEAETVSPLVNLLRGRRLPISYLGTGQRVPKDLYPATPPLVAACVLGEGVAALETLR
jgi:flagellar biosynthesis protein FlhF